MAEKNVKLQNPMTVDCTDSDFSVGMMVVVHLEKCSYAFDFGVEPNKAYPIKGYDGRHWYIDNPIVPGANIYFDARGLVPLAKIEAYQAALAGKPARTVTKKSPATLEAEELSSRLTRLRELIAVEGEIATHKTAGKALTEKHAALVAELYPKGKTKVKK